MNTLFFYKYFLKKVRPGEPAHITVSAHFHMNSSLNYTFFRQAVNLFLVNLLFCSWFLSLPRENITKSKVFRCFQEVQKRNQSQKLSGHMFKPRNKNNGLQRLTIKTSSENVNVITKCSKQKQNIGSINYSYLFSTLRM